MLDVINGGLEWFRTFCEEGFVIIQTDIGNVLITHGSEDGMFVCPIAEEMAYWDNVDLIMCCYPARVSSNHNEIAYKFPATWDGITIVSCLDDGETALFKPKVEEEEEFYIPDWD